jgi:serine/threonine protein kinase
MTLMPQQRLGRYVIVRQVGAGAMGEVYLAEDPHIDRRLAIKTVRLDTPPQAGGPAPDQLRLRFEREAKAAGRLVHPHIVTLFDAGEVDDVFFLAFEFVDGPDLAARVAQQPALTLNDVLRIGREAASALDAAHRAGIIHRDIKPSNLMLTSEGVLKIADFGIATLVGQAAQLTQTGMLVGTPHYLSPEQVTGEGPLDGRSDLFSIGVVLYELLAGRRPFEGASIAALLYSIVGTAPVPLGELRPDLPPRLAGAVMRLLSRERDQRFPTAAALAEELAAIERELGDSWGPIAATPPVAPAATIRGNDSMHAAGTEAISTSPGAVPPTIQLEAPSAEANRARGTPNRSAASQQTAATNAVPRRMVAIIALAAMLLAGGVFMTARWRGIDAGARDAPFPARVIEQEGAVNGQSDDLSPAVEPGQPAERSETAARLVEPSREEHQIVGGIVTFRISPPDAAESAVAKIDGLVRGLAAGSMMTLRPGRHRIEIIAAGYEPVELLVESRADGGATTELAVRLERR